MIKIFGHKGPDTDATCSALIWEWYLSQTKGKDARAFVLEPPNSEAVFVLQKWGVDMPDILGALTADDEVVIVDTNNPDELPENINEVNIAEVIDHHQLAGGLKTKGPIKFTIRPVAATATVMHWLIGRDMAVMPDAIKGLMLSCILSDTLEFRSPTTTPTDRVLAEKLAGELGINITEYATEMFAAKSNISKFSDAELLRMDSKVFEIGSKKLRISVLETTAPTLILDRKEGLMAAMPAICAADSVDEVLLFVVDILNEEATLFLPNEQVRAIATASFGVSFGAGLEAGLGAGAEGDSIVLPGIMSRKKQIIPNLKL